MARGDFLSGLSEGIFSRLGELRQDKETQDQDQKKQLISLLASQADRIEPESLPLLMGHIGELTGINKNKKFKTFWDAFSGLPSQDMGQQLGTKFREITQGMVGSRQAKDIRAKGDVSRFFDRPQGGMEKFVEGSFPGAPQVQQSRQQATNRQGAIGAEAGLKNRIVYKDPRADELEKIRERYEAQGLLQNERMNIQNYYKDRSREDTQRHQLDLEDERATHRAQSKVNNAAWILAKQRGFVEPTPALESEAALKLIEKGDADLALIRGRTDLTKAQAYLANITANSIKGGSGLTGPQASFANLEERKFGSAEEAMKAYTTSQAGIAEANKEVEQSLAELNAQLRAWQPGQPNVSFDPKTRSVTGLIGQQGRKPEEMNQLGNMILASGKVAPYKKKYDDALATLEKLRVQMTGQKNALTSHGKYIQFDPQTGEPQRAVRSDKDQFGQLPKAGQNVFRNIPAGKYHMNQTIETTKGRGKIVRVEPNPDGTFNYYIDYK